MSENFLSQLLIFIRNRDKVLNLIEDEEKKYIGTLEFIRSIHDEIKDMKDYPRLENEISNILSFIRRKKSTVMSINAIDVESKEKNEIMEFLKLSNREAASKMNKKFTKKELISFASKENYNIPKSLRKADYINRIIQSIKEEANNTKGNVFSDTKNNLVLQREFKSIISLDSDRAISELQKKTVKDLYLMAEASGHVFPKGISKNDIIHKILSQAKLSNQLDIISASVSPTSKFMKDFEDFFKIITRMSNNKIILSRVPRDSRITVDFQIIIKDVITHSIWVEVKLKNQSHKAMSTLIDNSNLFPFLIILNNSVPDKLVSDFQTMIPNNVAIFQFRDEKDLKRESERFYSFIREKWRNWFKNLEIM